MKIEEIRARIKSGWYNTHPTQHVEHPDDWYAEFECERDPDESFYDAIEREKWCEEMSHDIDYSRYEFSWKMGGDPVYDWGRLAVKHFDIMSKSEDLEDIRRIEKVISMLESDNYEDTVILRALHVITMKDVFRFGDYVLLADVLASDLKLLGHNPDINDEETIMKVCKILYHPIQYHIQ